MCERGRERELKTEKEREGGMEPATERKTYREKENGGG